MPKPTGKKKYSGSGYGEKDFQRELVQADKRQLQAERARQKDTTGKTQRMNALNKQYRELNSYVGPEMPGDRAARERSYYADLAQYGADYGDRAAYDSGYQRYKAAMQSIETAGAQTARTAAGTARMAQAGDMIQDVLRRGKRPFEVLGGKRAADFAAEDLALKGSRMERDSKIYTQMARGAQLTGDLELLRSARQGFSDSAGRYADAMAVYGERSRGARDSYLRKLEQTNKGAYYGETHGAQEIEGRLRDLRRKREQLDSMDVTWTDGMGGPAESKQDYVRARGQEMDAEIAQWEAALRHRNAIEKADEMRRVAESITNAPNFRELSEVGRAMLEGRNKQAKDSAIYPEEPEDPDNWRNYQSYLQKEKEALAQAGYVADLDSSYISEDAKPIYYALFAQDPQKAREWAEYWQGVGEDEYWRQIYEASGEDAGSRLGAFIQGTFANTVAGLNPFGEGGQYAAKLGSTMIGGGAAGLTEKGLFNTGALAGEIDVPIFGKQTLGSAYQLGSSMLQSAANATLAKMSGGAAGIVGGMGTILLGSSAAAQDYQQKLEQGWDESSAKWHALAAGAAEAGFEYLSLEKLVNQDVSRGFIRNVLLQAGIEASEEVNTTIANRISDAAISALSGYDNSIQQRAKELMSFGYEAGTANKMAQQEWLTELLNDALGGFLSGGMMTGGQYAMLPVYKVMDAVETNRYNEWTGALSSRTGEAAALAQYAADNNLEWASPEQSAEAVKSGADGTETNLNKSTLGQQVEEASQEKQTRKEARQERKANRQTGADVNRARIHIREQLAGKTVQEQQTVRDELIQKYGEAIAPTVSRAITMEAAKQAAQLDSTDAIRQAREAALAEISDEDMKRAVADGYDQAAYAKINQSGNAYEADRYIQQLRTTGTGNMSMEATVSAQDGQSRQVSITGMTEDGKGVKLADGTTVAVSKLQADADTMDAIQQMADLDMGQDADAVFQAYQKSGITGTEGYRWLMNYATAYNQGRVNSVSLEEAAARSSLDDRTVLEAYTLGQRSAHRETQQGLDRLEKLPKKKGVTGKTSKIDTDEIKGKTMNDSERQQFDYANRIVSALGVNLTWFSSKADAKGRFVGKNGAYENGAIYMDIHAGRNFESDLYSGILATMSHELSHFQQQYAPREYQKLKQFLFRQIAQNSKGGEDALDRLIWEKQRRSGYTISKRVAEDEVVADACQKMIRDSKAIHEFAREHESAVAGMVRWLKDWFKKLRAIFNRSSAAFSQEAELMDRLEANVKKAFGELWDKGITEAVRLHDEVGDIEGDQAQHSDRDTEYLELAKDPEKNQERLQEMVDEAAKRAGYKYKGYHGTAASFTVFDKDKIGSTYEADEEGFFFTTNENEAEFAAGDAQLKTGNNERIIPAYLKIRDPLIVNTKEASGTDYFDAWKYSLLDRMHGYDADGIIIKGTESTTYVVLDSDQIKSADPVTYDDSGNVIPLSQRFNTENQDIRYSQREQYEEAVEASDVLTRYSLREEPAPQKTIKAYKAFYVKDGKLYPPMVSNNTNEEDKQTVKKASSGTMKGLETPVGVWLDADVGGIAVDENGVPLRTKTTGRLQVQNDKGGGTLAFRPGWHLGEWPDASQFNVKDPVTGALKSVMPDNLVFAECEIAADVDYQLEAYEYGISDKGGFSRTQAGLPRVPTNGYYKYRTNVDPTTAPWYITGAMKVTMILSDEERRQICNQFGVTPQERASHKDIDLEAYGLKAGPVKQTENLERFRKNKASYDNDALLKAALEDENYSNAYVRRTLDFDNETLAKEFELDRISPDQVKKYRESYQTPEVMRSERESAAKANVSLDFQSESAAPSDGTLFSERDYFAGMTEEQVQEELTRLQQEKATAREKQRSLEKTEEYKRLFQEVLDKKSPEAISEFNKWADESGYVAAVDRAKEVDARRSEGAKVLDLLIDQRMEREEQEAIQKSGKSEAEYFAAQAVKDFGYTPYFYDAGYIVPNGKMLNFSGQKGRHFGSRGQDHRAIGMIYATTKGSAAMNRFMNLGNVRIMGESPGIDISNVTPLTKEQYATIRRFVNEARSDEYFNLDFSDERGNNLGSIEYEGRFSADLVINDIRHFFETGEVRQPSGLSAFYSERDYELPSDLELMDNAVEGLTEAGGEEYWKALLESAPELADDKAELKSMAKAYREQSRKLAEAERKLSEARQQLVTTDRKLRTRGIAGVTTNILKDLHAGDVKNRNVQQTVTDILTKAYQKGLDAIDAGKSQSEVWDVVYNEGIVKAADYILENATYSEKTSRKWTTVILNKYMTGEEGRYAVLDAISARVVPDWWESRARQPLQQTAVDRIVSRVEGRMQKQIDAQTQRAESAEASNQKLREDLDFWRTAQDNAAKQVTFLGKRLEEARADMKDVKQADAKERRQKTARIRSLENQLKAKREEAGAWKQMASRNESLLRAALKSKNADLEAQSKRAETAEAKLSSETVNARAWERNADLYAKQLDKQLEQKARIVKQLEAQVQREQDILSGKLKPIAMQRLLKAAREEAAGKAKAKKEEVFRNYKERKSQTAIRNRIKNLHAEMQRDLLRPREGHFVPEALIKPVVELLDMVNTQTKRAKSENAQAKIDAINAQYDKLKNDERYSQYYDETVKALLVELSSTLAGRSIYELNSDELADVYTAMKAMRTTIRNAIRADLVEKGKEIFEIGNELRQELRSGKGAHAYLLEKYHMSMLNAQRAFNRFGGYRQDSTWNKVYRMLDNAQLDMLRIEMEATRIFDPVLKAKADFERAQALTSIEKGALVDIGLRDENGKSVWITRGMMLSLYMHLQNEQNMKHLMYGGLTLPDFKRYYDGNPEAWGRGTVEIPALGARVSNLEQLLEEQGEEWVRSQYKTMEEDIKKMFESVRESIEKQMTDYDRKWIEASKDFFDNFSRRELNRVTNSMYGFSKAKVDNYFPIVTDSNFLKSEFDSISRNVSLENAGFMKDRVKASNPILLEDITRTVNRQISNVSRYAGLTEALKQFGNIYNVQTKGFTDSVKKAMAKSYGKTGQEYIQNLITDMVGGRSTPGTIFDRIKGNYAQAVLSANLSVTIKQAASYPTAAATVGWKPLMKALAKGGRNNRVFSRADRALIDAYSPLLWKRSQGAIDTEIGDMAHAQDWTKKAKWLMGWIEKTDIATVGRLWYAAEYYVKDNFKGLEKGTAEQIQNGESPFYQKVAEIFNRIVEETQPNYTVLQRPDILRNPNKLLRSLVMFSTQRFQNGQILIDAVAEYGAMRSLDRKGSTEGTKAARQEAKRKLTWAITSQAVSAVVLNAMTLLAGALMHRMNPWRDDDDEITLESTVGALLDGWVESLAGSFLGGSEIYEALDSLLTGSTYYGNDVGGLSSINDFASALITMGQKAVKLVGDENSKPEDWGNLAKNQLWKVGEYLSQMTGVPVANIKKILEGGVQHVQDAMETHLFSFEAGLARSNATNARRYAEAWAAGDVAKMQAVIDEMNRNLEKAGKSTDGARDAITKAAKERYEAGGIELDQYADFLRQAGYLEEDKIESKIRDFLRDELVTGDRTEKEVLRLLTELGGLTEDKAWKKVMEWKAKAETGDGEDEDEATKYSEYDALREDLRSGASFQEAAADYLAHGYTEKQVRDAAKDDLKARFQAGELSEGEAIDLLVEYSGKDENACWKTVQGWQGVMEHPEDEDYSWGQYDAIDEALAGNKEVKGLISELTAHGVKEDSIDQHIKGQLVQNYIDGKTNESQLKNQLSRYLGIVAKADVDKILKDANTKKLYGVAYSSLDEEYRAGKIGKAEIKQALMKQGGLTSGEADQKIRWYDLQKANPKLEISEAVCNAWYDGTTNGSQKYGHESAKDSGMSIERYLEARKYLDTIKDANGNGTGEDEVIQALAGMSGLTAREKDALYYERYKGGTRKGIYKTW